MSTAQLRILVKKTIRQDDPEMSKFLVKNLFDFVEAYESYDGSDLEAKNCDFQASFRESWLVMFRFMPLQVVESIFELFLSQVPFDSRKPELHLAYKQTKKLFLETAPFYARYAKTDLLDELFLRYNRDSTQSLLEIAEADTQYGIERQQFAKKLVFKFSDKALQEIKPRSQAFLELPASKNSSRMVAALMEEVSLWLYQERNRSNDARQDSFKTLRSQLEGYGIYDNEVVFGERYLYRGSRTPFNSNCGYVWAQPLVDTVYLLSRSPDIRKEKLLGNFKYYLLHADRVVTSVSNQFKSWSHGQLPIHDTWEKIEDIFEELWLADLTVININPRVAGKTSYEKNITWYYANLAKLLWLMGNTQALDRGTGTVVEILNAVIHYRHQLAPPVLQVEFPQFDVLNITFPFKEYHEQLFPHFFEPSTMPKHILTRQHKELNLLSALKQVTYLYKKMYPPDHADTLVSLESTYEPEESTFIAYLEKDAATTAAMKGSKIGAIAIADLESAAVQEFKGVGKALALNGLHRVAGGVKPNASVANFSSDVALLSKENTIANEINYRRSELKHP
jgi:hypothetical protein